MKEEIYVITTIASDPEKRKTRGEDR